MQLGTDVSFLPMSSTDRVTADGGPRRAIVAPWSGVGAAEAAAQLTTTIIAGRGVHRTAWASTPS